MEVKEVKSEKITLCDLIRGFMELATNKGRVSFPPLFFGTRLWHEFLYTLKKNHAPRFPELECIGRFDWDGPYPTSPDWGNVALALNLICVPNGHDLRVFLHPERRRRTNQLALTHRELLETMFKIACETKNFFED